MAAHVDLIKRKDATDAERCFTSLAELELAIDLYVAHHNTFIWGPPARPASWPGHAKAAPPPQDKHRTERHTALLVAAEH